MVLMLRSLTEAEQKLFGTLLPVENSRKKIALSIKEKANVREKVSDDTHLLIHCAQDSHAIVCLEIAAAFFDCEVILEDNASLSLVCLQKSPQSQIRQRSLVGAGAKIHWHTISLGAELSQELVSEVKGDNAMSSVESVSFVKGGERHAVSVRNVFSAQNGRGEIVMRSVAEDQARSEQRGMIEIGPQGNGTDTYLTQEVLMLDPTAKVDAIPALEIRTNDVKASHSASVSRVTEEDLFYFGSRGISINEAREMYIEGFLSASAENIPDKGMRGMVRDHLAKKYHRV